MITILSIVILQTVLAIIVCEIYNQRAKRTLEKVFKSIGYNVYWFAEGTTKTTERNNKEWSEYHKRRSREQKLYDYLGVKYKEKEAGFYKVKKN